MESASTPYFSPLSKAKANSKITNLRKIGKHWFKGALAYRKQPLQKWVLLFCY